MIERDSPCLDMLGIGSLNFQTWVSAICTGGDYSAHILGRWKGKGLGKYGAVDFAGWLILALITVFLWARRYNVQK